MATMNNMLLTYSKSTSNLENMSNKMKNFADKVTKASVGTKKFNNSLKSNSTFTDAISSRLGKLANSFINVENVQKGIKIADQFINTNSRLNSINDGLQTQLELQNKIFGAAKRSRGSYMEMADAVADMGTMAGSSFESNDEMIAFTELAQKSIRAGSTGKEEQSGAMNQLTQSMSSGSLDSNGLGTIMETAPMIADAISQYMGVSEDKLKELASQGAITSDVIKNSMFTAADNINSKFEQVPMTFDDVWNSIKNGGLQAFSGILTKMNELINTDGFQQFINGITVGLNLLSQAVGWVIDMIVDNWDTVSSILVLVGSIISANIISSMIEAVPLLAANTAGWISMALPILAVVGVIALVISAVRQMGVSWQQILGFVGGIIGVFIGNVYNRFARLWNYVASFVNFFGNVFKDPINSIKLLFLDLAGTVLGYIEKMFKGIENLINLIPGLDKIHFTDNLTNYVNGLKESAEKTRKEAGLTEYMKPKEYVDYSDAYKMGNDIGSSLTDKLGNMFSGSSEKAPPDFSNFGTINNPATVQGTGSGGTVDVNMDDDSIKYIKELAEREYINNFSTATLAPQVQISFGDIRETADANKVQGIIEKVLREEIAVVREGY